MVSESFTNKFKIKLINYFCLCWVFWLLHGPSLVAAWGATLHCGTWASHYSGFFCCGAQTLGTWASVVSAHRLHSCSVQTPGCTGFRVVECGSVVVMHGLSCSAAREIFPDEGLNPCPLDWQADSYLLYHQGSPIFESWCEFLFIYFAGCNLKACISELWKILFDYFFDNGFSSVFSSVSPGH